MSTVPCGVGACQELAGQGGVCDKHRANVADILDRDGLARLYVELNLGLLPGRAGSEGPVVSMSREKRLPISGACRDAQVQILAVLVTLETELRISQGWVPAPRRGREGPTLQGACEVLRDHLDAWLSPETATEVLRLRRLARGALGLTGPRSNSVDAPCPSCNTPALLRRNGSDHIACGYCGEVVTRDEVEQWLDPIIEREAA